MYNKKVLNLKTVNSFLLKNISLKSFYLVIMSNLRRLQGRNTKVKFMSWILEKNYVGSLNYSEKLVKYDNFTTKNAELKSINSLMQKNITL